MDLDIWTITDKTIGTRTVDLSGGAVPVGCLGPLAQSRGADWSVQWTAL